MLLAIDIGNTTIEFGVYDKNTLTGSFRISTKRDITSDELWLYISQFFEHSRISFEHVDDVAISSVVPQINHAVINAARKYGIEPKIIGENLPCNMPVFYDTPKTLGMDRLVSAYAAYKIFHSAAVIVDFGTATTVDAVSENGEFLGGMIFPGIKTAVNALYDKTANLPKIEITKPDFVIGKSTVGSMQLGIYTGYLGAVENMVKQMKSIVGKNSKVIATGGFSRLFASEAIFDAVVPKLQLDGIRMIYEDFSGEQYE